MSKASFPGLFQTGQTASSNRGESNNQFSSPERRAIPPTSTFTFTSLEGQEDLLRRRQESVSPLKSYSGITSSPTLLSSYQQSQQSQPLPHWQPQNGSISFSDSSSNASASDLISFSTGSPRKKGLGSSGPAGIELRSFRTINDQVLLEMNQRAQQITQTAKIIPLPSLSPMGAHMFSYSEAGSGGQNKPRTPSRRSSIRHKSRSSMGSGSSSSALPNSTANSSRSNNRFSVIHNQGFAKMESITQHYAVNPHINNNANVKSDCDRRDSTAFLIDRTQALALGRVGDIEDEEGENGNENENENGDTNNKHNFGFRNGNNGLLSLPIKRDNVTGKTISPVKRRKVDQWGNKLELKKCGGTINVPQRIITSTSCLSQNNGQRSVNQNSSSTRLPQISTDNNNNYRGQHDQQRIGLNSINNSPSISSRGDSSISGIRNHHSKIDYNGIDINVKPVVNNSTEIRQVGSNTASAAAKPRSYGMLPRSQTASKIPRNVSLKGVNSVPTNPATNASMNFKANTNPATNSNFKTNFSTNTTFRPSLATMTASSSNRMLSGDNSSLKPTQQTNNAGQVRPKTEPSVGRGGSLGSRIPRSVL